MARGKKENERMKVKLVICNRKAVVSDGSSPYDSDSLRTVPMFS